MNSNSDELTRAYLDRFAIEWRHLEVPDCATTECSLFGKALPTPIMAGGMAHYQGMRDGGATLFAQGVKEAGSVMWRGYCTDDELDALLAMDVPAGRIMKPFADRDLVFRAIDHDRKAGAFAMAMDIDHVFDRRGNTCVFFEKPLAVQTADTLREYAQASGEMPFLPKGVLSVHDAEVCAKAGVPGFIISHHQNMFPWSVPPLAVLPEIRRAVGPDMTIIVDCGLDSGYEVFKALALGADAVCVARPLRTEFVEKGPEAVRDRLVRMNDELRACLVRTGAADIRHIDPSVIREL